MEIPDHYRFVDLDASFNEMPQKVRDLFQRCLPRIDFRERYSRGVEALMRRFAFTRARKIGQSIEGAAQAEGFQGFTFSKNDPRSGAFTCFLVFPRFPVAILSSVESTEANEIDRGIGPEMVRPVAGDETDQFLNSIRAAAGAMRFGVTAAP